MPEFCNLNGLFHKLHSVARNPVSQMRSRLTTFKQHHFRASTLVLYVVCKSQSSVVNHKSTRGASLHALWQTKRPHGLSLSNGVNLVCGYDRFFLDLLLLLLLLLCVVCCWNSSSSLRAEQAFFHQWISYAAPKPTHTLLHIHPRAKSQHRSFKFRVRLLRSILFCFFIHCYSGAVFTTSCVSGKHALKPVSLRTESKLQYVNFASELDSTDHEAARTGGALRSCPDPSFDVLRSITFGQFFSGPVKTSNG